MVFNHLTGHDVAGPFQQGVTIVRLIHGFGVAVAIIGAAGAAFAASEYEGAIKARQGLMRLNAFTIGQMAAMAKGETPYDAAAAQTLADNMVMLTKLDTGALWPAGSDNAATEGTNALPAAWAEGSDIGAKYMAWSDASVAMQAAAGKDLASLQGAMEALGGSCGGCHKAFRASQ